MTKPGLDQMRTVLIVDSSPTILLYHSILMQRLQYAVLTAQDPYQALQLTELTVPSIILTGLTFAEADGIDLIRNVKSGSRTKAVPVIVLTALENSATRADCIAAGCDAYLRKPVEPSCLFWTVQELAEQVPRQFARISTNVRTITDGREEYATSLSEGGLFVRTLVPRRQHELLSLNLFINGREIRTRAMVLYSIDIGRGTFKEPGMGLKFVEISEDDLDYLRKFIRDHLVADVGPLAVNVNERFAAASAGDDRPKGRLAVLGSAIKRWISPSSRRGSKAA